ncbi:MAG: hypothetical protein KJN62_04930 [Deltaproteobacteria bacterium]|nr:hypothetical protein [Deltaproteobacteria bacterium]
MAHYLETPDARFQLKLLPRHEKTSIREGDYSPFSTIRNSDQLASIIEASIVSDAGSGIKNVFIFIQKDDYRFSKGKSRPANNRDIDQAWQNVFTYLTDSNQKDSVVILKDQVDDNGRLLQWSPLFYCQYRQIFFHPPCPQCGFPLKLCDDDDLLVRMNLKPYATSVTRYLFCPNCNDTVNKSPFYVSTRGSSDPPTVKDRNDLIKGFGQLVNNGNEHTNIPCRNCTSFQECYQGNHLSDSRIAAVSFYPFFMITLDAPSMHVLDFLPLVAGANPDDVANRLQAEGQWSRLEYIKNFDEPYSQSSLFFFYKDQKHFLEVLYVKLCLLEQLAQLVFEGLDTFKYPDLALSLDRIWVNVADHSEMMPLLWNFQLQFIGIGGDSNQPSFPYKSDQSHALSFLGFSWFSVLFMNSGQDCVKINSEIEKIMSLSASTDGLDNESRLKIYQSHIFSPENIFWNPDQHHGYEDITNFLTQSLDLGFLLIQKSRGAAPEWSHTDFWGKYKHLKAEIKNALFMPETKNHSALAADGTKDIYDILVRISRKWRGEMETIAQGPEQDTADLSMEEKKIDRTNSDSLDDVIIKKTVVLTPDIFREEPSSHDISEDRQPETSLKRREPALPPSAIDHGSEPLDDLPETRIIDQNVLKDQPLPPIESRDDDIPETVIIAPHEPLVSQRESHPKPVEESTESGQTKQPDSEAPEGSAENETSPGTKKPVIDDVPETVIINYKKSQGGQ